LKYKKSVPEDAHKSTSSDHVYSHIYNTRSNYQNSDDIQDIHDILYHIQNDISGIHDNTLNTSYDDDSNLGQNQHSFFINLPYHIYYIICCPYNKYNRKPKQYTPRRIHKLVSFSWHPHFNTF
jgi:hypothetical protein